MLIHSTDVAWIPFIHVVQRNKAYRERIKFEIGIRFSTRRSAPETAFSLSALTPTWWETYSSRAEVYPLPRDKLHVKAMVAHVRPTEIWYVFWVSSWKLPDLFHVPFAFVFCARAFLPDTFSFVCLLQILSVSRVKAIPGRFSFSWLLLLEQ